MVKKKYKQITEPSNQGFQVRIVRNNKEYSRYFAHKTWGNKGKSLKGAISWRDQMLVLLQESKRYDQEPRIPLNKKSTGVVGVTRTIQYDKRRDAHHLVYSCHWRKNGNGHTKTFHVGRAEDVSTDEEFHAFRTAVQFRKEYELFKERGIENNFFPERYKEWRQKKFYSELNVA
jgi:hypothetical protein